MKTSKNKRIHAGWKILGIIRFQDTNRFSYQCTKCGVKVVSGEPFVASALDCK